MPDYLWIWFCKAHVSHINTVIHCSEEEILTLGYEDNYFRCEQKGWPLPWQCWVYQCCTTLIHELWISKELTVVYFQENYFFFLNGSSPLKHHWFKWESLLYSNSLTANSASNSLCFSLITAIGLAGNNFSTNPLDCVAVFCLKIVRLNQSVVMLVRADDHTAFVV